MAEELIPGLIIGHGLKQLIGFEVDEPRELALMQRA